MLLLLLNFSAAVAVVVDAVAVNLFLLLLLLLLNFSVAVVADVDSTTAPLEWSLTTKASSLSVESSARLSSTGDSVRDVCLQGISSPLPSGSVLVLQRTERSLW